MIKRTTTSTPILIIALTLFLPVGNTATLNLSNVPLFIAQPVDPNVFIELDDSGSMDWEILTEKHWHFCAYVFTGNCGWLVDNGKWRSNTGTGDYDYFVYLYANADNAYDNDCGPDWRANAESCPDSLTFDWRVLSSSLNVLYFDPANDYKPWPGFPDASFTGARSNPQSGQAGYDIIRDLTGFQYNVWLDDAGFSGARPDGPGTKNATPNGMVDWWDTYMHYTVNADSITVETIATDANGENPQVVSSTTISGSDTDPWGHTVDEIKQNIANWYQYYRRRAFVAKAAIANVIQNNPGYRYGLSVINDWGSLFIEVPDSPPYITHNAELLNSLYSFDWQPQGTPLREALERTGRYFDHTLPGKADPITYACQKNFTILFTDGYWNGPDPGVDDQDGDGIADTLADVGILYYNTDLSPLPDEVSPDAFDSNTSQHMVTYTVAFGITGNLQDIDGDGWPDPSLSESDNWGNPYASDLEKVDDLWHTAFNTKGRFISAATPQAVIDSLAKVLENISDRIGSAASVALDSGTLNNNSRLYQARFDSGDWSGQLIAYDIQADGSIGTAQWELGCRLNGGSCAVTGSSYPGQDWNLGRVIITRKPSTGAGIPFRWPADPSAPGATELDSSQIAALNTDPDSNSGDGKGQERLEFLRGKSVSGMRTRLSILGDIIHSAPIFVGSPAFNYPDTLESVPYTNFRTTHANRTPMIYVGANDGMLHGIDASLGTDGGMEKLAYVPSAVFSRLNELTSPNYGGAIPHRYFVDGDVTAGDAFFSGAWHTVLVGSLRGGGQGIFALDVTDPSSFSEAAADNIVLWEFTDADDSDLGFTFSRPAIVKLNNGKWAAVFGNGYNNTEPDTHVSSSGNAVLYIVDLETGTLIKKFDTKKGTSADPSGSGRANGLATPAPVDVNADYQVDYIYAGDLFGNLWKIDVTDTNPAAWDFAYYDAGKPQPLFQAKDSGGTPQPITTRPEVGKHPEHDGYLIYFGTGKYLENGIDNDPAGAQTQTFYAIWDKNDTSMTTADRSSWGRDHLLRQCVIKEVSQFGRELRVSTDYSIQWHTGTGLPSAAVGSTPSYCPEPTPGATHLGWYLDLVNLAEGSNTDNYGEKQVTNPILRNGKIIFTTLLPSDNPCDYGGTGWLMELDAFDGGLLPFSPFDLTGDDQFDQNDFVDAGDLDGDGDSDKVPSSGLKSKVGILSRPSILEDSNPTRELKYASGSTGNIENVTEHRGENATGRMSWRQIQ